MSDSPRARRAAASHDPSGGIPARERILRSAARLFHEVGYAGTPVSRIAKDAGMTAANMYWHFPSKKDVLGEILRSTYAEVHERLVAAVPDAPAPARLVAFVHSYTGSQLEMLSDRTRFGYAALATSLPHEEQVDLQRRLGTPCHELLHDILRQGVKATVFDVEDVVVTSFAIATICENAYTWYRTDDRLSMDEVLGQYAAIALSMVGHEGPPPTADSEVTQSFGIDP